MQMSQYTIWYIIFEILVLIFTFIHLVIILTWKNENKAKDKYLSLLSIMLINFVYRCVESFVLLIMISNDYFSVFEVFEAFVYKGYAWYISIVFVYLMTVSTSVLVQKRLEHKSRLIKAIVSVIFSYLILGFGVGIGEYLIHVMTQHMLK